MGNNEVKAIERTNVNIELRIQIKILITVLYNEFCQCKFSVVKFGSKIPLHLNDECLQSIRFRWLKLRSIHFRRTDRREKKIFLLWDSSKYNIHDIWCLPYRFFYCCLKIIV